MRQLPVNKTVVLTITLLREEEPPYCYHKNKLQKASPFFFFDAKGDLFLPAHSMSLVSSLHLTSPLYYYPLVLLSKTD